MPTYTAQLTTPASADQAFAYLAQFDNTQHWDPGVSSARPLSDGPPALGSRYAVTVELGGGAEELIYEITEYDPPRRVVLVADGSKFVSHDEITVAPDGDGSQRHLSGRVVAQRADEDRCALRWPGAAHGRRCGSGGVDPRTGPSGRLSRVVGAGSDGAGSPTYRLLADLPVRISDYALEGRALAVSSGWERLTTVIRLAGAGAVGEGEDVWIDNDDQRRFVAAGPVLELAGTWTLDAFSRHLDGIALFPDAPSPLGADFRRWGFEAAALDLALRQAGRSLADVLGRVPAPVRWVLSLRLATPGESSSVAPLGRAPRRLTGAALQARRGRGLG